MGWLNDARTWFDLQVPVGLDGASYSTVAHVPGSIRAASGGEQMQFGGLAAVAGYVVTLRYRADMRPTWRIRDPAGNRNYQIAVIQDPDGLREWIRVLVQEIQ